MFLNSKTSDGRKGRAREGRSCHTVNFKEPTEVYGREILMDNINVSCSYCISRRLCSADPSVEMFMLT